MFCESCRLTHRWWTDSLLLLALLFPSRDAACFRTLVNMSRNVLEETSRRGLSRASIEQDMSMAQSLTSMRQLPQVYRVAAVEAHLHQPVAFRYVILSSINFSKNVAASTRIWLLLSPPPRTAGTTSFKSLYPCLIKSRRFCSERM